MSAVDVSARALAAGFSNGPDSAHTGKTMMLPELRALLAASGPDATIADYRAAAIEANAMSKRTAATRAKTFYNLRKLYALDTGVPLFAALRALWAVDAAAQPLIAAACAVARDPALRATAAPVLALSPGDRTGPAELAAAVAERFPGRYNASVAHHIGQNAGATWVQAGILSGVLTKTRVRPDPTFPAVAYGLYLGHLEGHSGPALFTTLWARLLDAPESTLRALTETAARQGWLEVRAAGGMLDITFQHLDALGHTSAG